MRTIKHRTRSFLIVALGVALASGAYADNKKGGSKPAAGDKGKGGGAAGGGAGSGAGGGDASGDEGIEIDQPAGQGSGGGDSGTIDMEQEDQQQPPGNLEAELNATETQQTVKTGPVKKTPLSWKDILVVVRKPFLKVRRTELNPFTSVTMNDNMITHYGVGGEFAYYLTDVLAVGVEGQYYIHNFGEPFDLVARQARRLPTVNQYNWSAALNFHYVPVYGKFAVLDHRLVAWEVFFTGGVGAGQSEVIPRDTKFPGFTNILIEPNVGASMRFFIAKWLTVNLGIRDYMFIDHFEPTDRSPTMNATASEAKDNADSAFINNIMFQIGVSFWLPTTFEYTTFR
ncbi:MAG TPA: outer membrane beta-barrel domain-containing protein [Kofleriaceae bacterium]|nr:outer membrane beta-barrel domain-containing protein [Kofleriaceae bacterium]